MFFLSFAQLFPTLAIFSIWFQKLWRRARGDLDANSGRKATLDSRRRTPVLSDFDNNDKKTHVYAGLYAAYVVSESQAVLAYVAQIASLLHNSSHVIGIYVLCNTSEICFSRKPDRVG